MSYDLFFKPRAAVWSPEAFANYFAERRHYKVEGSQAWYQNEDTGVYFVFELQDDPEEAHPVAFNLNYFRPSFFGVEAEPEVSAFVRALDLVVSDPQTHGMGEGEYNSELFLSGWNHGNEFGYSAILREPANRENLVCFPSEKLMRAWSWNHRRTQLQDELGESKFVPRIMFLVLAGQPVTAAVWPDGIPIAVPEVDYFIIPRKELAPRRMLRKVEDTTLLASKDLSPILQQYSAATEGGARVLQYDNPPKPVREFVASLPADDSPLEGVGADRVLDRELVERFST